MKRGILNESAKTYFKNFFSYFSLSLLYASFILLGLIATYFLFPVIVLVVIFVFTPFTFALHYSVEAIKRGGGFSFKTFFQGYAKYYSIEYRGGYSSIRNLVFSALIFFGIMLFVFMPFELYEIYNNKGIYDMIMSTEEINYETFYNLIIENETFNLGFMIAFAVGGLISSMLYLHFHLKRSILISNQLFAQVPQPMAMVKHFGKYQFKLFRGKFYKEYFKMIFFPLVIYIIGFGLGFFIHFNYISKVPDDALAFSFIMGTLFLIPLYPFIAIYMDNIVFFHINSFMISYAKSVIYNLNRLPLDRLTKDERVMVEEMLKNADIIIKNTPED